MFSKMYGRISLNLIFFLLSFVSFNSFAEVTESYQNDSKYPYTVEIEGKAGNVRHIGRWKLFAPVWQREDALIFTSVIGMLDSNYALEGNFGGGYKWKYNDNVLGLYGYYDLRRTTYKNVMHQATVGAEVLREYFEARVNIYLSPNTKRLIGTNHDIATNINGLNTNVLDNVNRRYEVALWGFDVETGGSLPALNALSAYIGYYHFGREGIISIDGVRFRSEYQINDFFKIHGEVSYDNKRKTSYYGGISLTVAFGKGKSQLQGLDAKMVKMPIRDVDIEVGELKQIERKVSQVPGRYRYVKLHEVLGDVNKITGFKIFDNGIGKVGDIPTEAIPLSLRQELGSVIIGYLKNEFDGILLQGDNGQVIPINLKDSTQVTRARVGGANPQVVDEAINSLGRDAIHDVIGVVAIPVGMPLPALPPIDPAEQGAIEQYRYMYNMMGIQTLPANRVIADIRAAAPGNANVNNLLDTIERFRQEQPQALIDPAGYNRLDLMCEAWTFINQFPAYQAQLVNILGQP